ncbi:MAG: iron donor protein CyaY [Betaproteobacteria bacterium]|nr:iron donor protein CyaY [Betaproteobacteria bacterium]
MTQSEYEQQAEETLNAIEEALEAADTDDVDYERRAAGILELEFGDGSKIIINRQSATQEIWVAARAGGFHFRWTGQAWEDTRDGTELFRALERLASSQAGAAVELTRGRP